MRLLLLVLHFALVSMTIHGQEVRNPTPPKPSLPTLQITATTATGADYKPMLGAMTCDGAGTVYVPMQNSSVQTGWNQLIAFDRKGETRTVTLKSPEGLTARRMFMSESGFLYLMAQNTKRPEKVEYWIPDVYVIRFDRNGEYDSKLKLDASFLPSGSFAVFPSGEIIVAGLRSAKDR